MRLLSFLVSLWLSGSGLVQAQLLVTPALPNLEDTITVLFDATQGNGALAGFSGNVYAHTGVLTPFSSDSSDWQYVVSSWGTADTMVQMDSVGPDLYSLRFQIGDYYGLPAGTPATHLAFVFRNASGSVVGRDADGSDMFWPLVAGAGGGAYASHTFDGTELLIFSEGGTALGFRAFANDILEAAPIPDTAQPWTSTISVVADPIPSTLTEFSDRLELDAGLLKATILKSDLEIRFIRGGDTLIRTLSTPTAIADGPGFFRLEIDPSETWQGTGSRAIPINRRGRTLPVYNSQAGGYGYGAETMNIATPMALSSKGYGLYWDHMGPATWNIGAADPARLDYQTELAPPNLFVFGGSTYDQSLAAYIKLTGQPVLPPRWAMGFIQSKYGYRNAADALNTVDDLLAGGFPLDALVLDLYWFGQPNRMGDLDWDLAAFPDPPGFLNELRSRNVEPILITETYFTTISDHYGFLDSEQFFAQDMFGDSYVLGSFWTGPSALLDITDSAARDWFWDRYVQLLANGSLGWWLDLGEPETHPSDMVHDGGSARKIHNHYSLEWAKMLGEGYAANYPNERMFNLFRSGYAGMQRYGSIPWSGDVQRSWSGLEAQIPVMLGMSMTGIAWMHSDMGGFTGTFNPELYLRWTQLSAFTPVMRAHGVDNTITEPVYLNEPFRTRARNAIKLRYRLLPYHYSLARRYAVTGRPMALPMDYFDPQNLVLQNRNDQYFWGRDVVVAPVIAPGVTSRSVQLPAGDWINWWTESLTTGPAEISVSAPLQTLPLFVRAGAVLPMAPADMDNAAKFDDGHLEFHVFADDEGTALIGECYLDNGIRPNAESSGDFELIAANGGRDESAYFLQMSRTGSGWTGSATTRIIDQSWHRMGTPPGSVTRDGLTLTQLEDSLAWVTSSTGWWYDDSRNRVWVRFSWDMNPTIVRLEGAAVGVEPLTVQQPVSFTAWPNPFSESIIWNLELPAVSDLDILLTDAYGRNIMQKQMGNFAGGSIQQTLSATEYQLSPGMYFLEARYLGGQQRIAVVYSP